MVESRENHCHPTSGFQKSKPLGKKVALKAETNDLEEILVVRAMPKITPLPMLQNVTF